MLTHHDIDTNVTLSSRCVYRTVLSVYCVYYLQSLCGAGGGYPLLAKLIHHLVKVYSYEERLQTVHLTRIGTLVGVWMRFAKACDAIWQLTTLFILALSSPAIISERNELELGLEKCFICQRAGGRFFHWLLLLQINDRTIISIYFSCILLLRPINVCKRVKIKIYLWISQVSLQQL